MRPPLRHRFIRRVLRHHVLVLVVATLCTVAAALVATRLVVDSDLRRLLPTDHPVVTSLDELERDFHGTGSVNVVLAGGDAPARHALADAVAGALAGHPLLVDVDYRLPSEFFVEHALYYLTEPEMERLEELVDAWSHYHVCTAEPDLCTLPPDPKAPERLRAFVDQHRDSAWKRTGFRDYYEREGVQAQVLLLHPTQPSTDLDFAAEVVAEVRRVVAEVHARADGPWTAAGVRVNVVGPYVVKADERETIARDMVRGGIVGVTGVIAILWLLFRSLRAVLILLVPLLYGVTWSLAATQLMLGHLNSMTSLISSVVMGMGIDAGIHFYSRAERERRRFDHRTAIRRAFHHLVVPLFVASGTTVGAFLVMAWSDFPAFREFGIIAAVGVGLCLLSMVTVLPALASLTGIKRSIRAPERDPGPRLLSKVVLARPGLLFALLVVSVIASFQGVRRVSFEYDGRALQSAHARATTEADTRLISEIFGRDIHAGVLVVRGLAETRVALEQARARWSARQADGRSVVAELFAAPDLLPPATVDPKARQEAIAELDELIGDETWERIDAEAAERKPGSPGLTRDDAKTLRKMLAAKPVSIDRLPPRVLSKVRAEGDVYGIFAYPDFDAADIRRGVEFMAETADYVPAGVERSFVGETTVYATMYEMMWREAPIVLGMASVLIAALVLWQVRFSFGLMFMTLLPLAIGLFWTLAIMGATRLEFTLFNLPIMPAVLGIGVDNGVYLVDRMRKLRERRHGLANAVDETGGAIAAATATTTVGFAALLVADSGGLRSIGALAVLGISMAALAALLVLPTLSMLGRGRGGGGGRPSVS